ncbi:MAG: SufD family Fe-S cluster assembly protein [Candidatus Woesearchaeota archaeon]
MSKKQISDEKTIKELIFNAEKAAKFSEVDTTKIHDQNFPKLLLHKNKIISKKDVEGLVVNAKETRNGIKAKIIVKKKIELPAYFCFGVLDENYNQKIDIEIIAEENSEAKIYAFCTFPKAENVKHIMRAKYILKKNSKIDYHEFHYHGNKGALVIPKIFVSCKENSIFNTSITSLHGTIGRMKYFVNVELDKNAKCAAISKIKGKGNDRIIIIENAKLKGDYSSAVIKSRLISSENSRAVFKGEIIGIGDESRGHVDCKEIITDNGYAKTIPKLKVLNKKARVTHEASIGSVDKKEIQTLQARGLSKEEAINLIIKGMLE